ncbi:MAG: hypothetical protein AAGH64_00760 [Planctomycetota bacterium]
MVRTRGARRGFLIVAVMVLLLVVVVTTTWMLTSGSYRSNLAQRRIDAYQHHHELMSVRHIATRWMTRQRNLADLEEFAGNPADLSDPPVVYSTTLPDGLSVRLTLERGQGVPTRDLDAATSEQQRMLMENLLDALGGMTDLEEVTRSVGPTRLVLTSAPDIVLEAVGASDPTVTDALLRARAEGVTATGAIQTALQNAGVDPQLARAIASDLFMNETRLWKLTAMTERDGNRRAYRLYMMQDAESSQILQWKLLEARLLDGEDPSGGGSLPGSDGAFPARSGPVR